MTIPHSGAAVTPMTTIRAFPDNPVFRVARKLGGGWDEDEMKELLPFLLALEEMMDAIVARPGREP